MSCNSGASDACARERTTGPRRARVTKAVMTAAITQNSINTTWAGMLNTKGVSSYISYYVTPSVTGPDANPIEAGEMRSILEESQRNTLFDHMFIKRIIDKMSQAEETQQICAFIELSSGSVRDANLNTRLEQMLTVGKHSTRQLVCLFSMTIVRQYPNDVKATVLSLKEKGILTYISDFGTEEDDINHIKALPIEGVVWSSILTKDSEGKRQKTETLHKSMKEMQESGYRSIQPNIETAEALAKSWGIGVDYLMGDFIHAPSDEPDFNASQYQ